MQLCVSRQDCILDVCVLKKSTYGDNKSPAIEHVLETSAISVCLYTKASLERRLCGSCQVSGTMTVRDENMESSSIFLNRKQCKINVTSYMTELTKYTTNGKQHL